MLIIFESINAFNAGQAFDFVMASAGFSLPLIHLISAISLLSYDWRRHIISTMSLFSAVVPSLTRHSNKLFESVHITSGSGIRNIASIGDLIAAPISNPWAMAYSSEARTLRATPLHLFEDQLSWLCPFWSC